MRVSVTGATGFIGRALVRRLLAEKHAVKIFARDAEKGEELAAQGAEVIRGDLRHPGAIEHLAEGAELLFHLAARVSGPGTREQYMDANLGGTERMLSACARQKVRRVVHLSSLAVYGPLVGPGPITEETAFDEKPERRGFYAESKIAGDEFAASFAKERGLSVAILRPGLVYGPGRVPLGLLAFPAGKLKFVFGRKRLHLPVNYIENLIDAMLAAATADTGGPEDFNVVDEENLTLGEYHQAVNDAAGGATIFLPGLPVLLASPAVDVVTRAIGVMGDSRISWRQLRRMLEDRVYSTERIRKRTGWSARVGVREALQRSFAGAKGNGEAETETS